MSSDCLLPPSLPLTDMIATKVENVYEVYLPPEVRVLLEQIRFVISLGLEAIPLTCIGADGYVRRLLFWMLAPIVFILLVALFAVIDRWRLKDLSISRVAKQVLPTFLRLGFVVYPLVTNVSPASRFVHSLVAHCRVRHCRAPSYLPAYPTGSTVRLDIDHPPPTPHRLLAGRVRGVFMLCL